MQSQLPPYYVSFLVFVCVRGLLRTYFLDYWSHYNGVDVDYIRRKPLITVTVEVEVGGEVFLVPEYNIECVWVWVFVTKCVNIRALPRASVHSYFSTCMLFLQIFFFKSVLRKMLLGGVEMKKRKHWHCKQTADNKHHQETLLRRTSTCHRHPALPTAHPGPTSPPQPAFPL